MLYIGFKESIGQTPPTFRKRVQDLIQISGRLLKAINPLMVYLNTG